MSSTTKQAQTINNLSGANHGDPFAAVTAARIRSGLKSPAPISRESMCWGGKPKRR